MDTSIRKASIKDLEDILRLNKALFDSETVFNDEYNLNWTYSKFGRDYFERMINSGIAIVAEIDKKVVGYLVASIHIFSFRKDNPIAELGNMYVEEKYRRHGIGKKLVNEMMQVAKEKGVKRVKVEAAFQNENAIKFYKSCGFEEFDIILQSRLD